MVYTCDGSADVKIQIEPIKFIHVFTTHLQVLYKVVNSMNFGVRVGQSMELQDFIVSKTKDDDSLILLLSDMKIDSVCFDERIDYIVIYQKNREIVKYDAQVWRFMIEGRKSRQLSDHVGVQCSIELRS
jgi:hypothetical protein